MHNEIVVGLDDSPSGLAAAVGRREASEATPCCVPSWTTPPPWRRHDHHRWRAVDQPLPRACPRTMR